MPIYEYVYDGITFIRESPNKKLLLEYICSLESIKAQAQRAMLEEEERVFVDDELAPYRVREL